MLQKNKFFSIIKEWCGDKIEIASIDECYVDFSDYNKYCDDVVSYLKKMQNITKFHHNI